MILPLWVLIGVLGLTSVVIIFIDWPRGAKADRDAFLFQAKFLGAWYFCALGDWLQGPLVFKMAHQHLNDSYLVNQLLGIGYLSGMCCAFVAGGIADKYSRKRACQAYCVTYILSCLLTHFRSYYALFAARVLGGAATCILYSCFEAYYVKRHRALAYDEGMLNDTLKRMWFGNYGLAIIAGLLCHLVLAAVPVYQQNPLATGPAASSEKTVAHYFYVGGETAVFDTALVFLTCGLVWISLFWTHDQDRGSAFGRRSFPSLGEEGMEVDEADNRRPGSIPLDTVSSLSLKQAEASILSSTTDSIKEIYHDSSLFRVGMLVAFTESAMYVFIPSWDPALSEYGAVLNSTNPQETIDRGAIFAAMMMACMCGAQFFSYRNRLAEKEYADKKSDNSLERAEEDDFVKATSVTVDVVSPYSITAEDRSERDDDRVQEYRLLNTLYRFGEKSSWTAAICFLGIGALLIPSHSDSQPLLFSFLTPSISRYVFADKVKPALIAYYMTTVSLFILILSYEFTVGFFFPLSGCIKARVVPEENRATIYNLYRVPLNLLAVTILFSPQLDDLFRKFCVCFLLAGGAALTFRKMRRKLKQSFEERDLIFPISKEHDFVGDSRQSTTDTVNIGERENSEIEDFVIATESAPTPAISERPLYGTIETK